MLPRPRPLILLKCLCKRLAEMPGPGEFLWVHLKGCKQRGWELGQQRWRWLKPYSRWGFPPSGMIKMTQVTGFDPRSNCVVTAGISLRQIPAELQSIV